MAAQILAPIPNITPAPINNGGSQVNQSKEEDFWGSDGFTFGDLVDMFNPMHHMPVISNYYREQTNDDASEGSRIVGGLLFGSLIGGVAGLVTSIANSAVRHETHHDLSEHIIDMAQDSLDGTHLFARSDVLDVVGLDKNPQPTKLSAALDSNPFFLQALEDTLNNDTYHSANASQAEHVSVQRTRDWGQV